jgi:hypothetical protein
LHCLAGLVDDPVALDTQLSVFLDDRLRLRMARHCEQAEKREQYDGGQRPRPIQTVPRSTRQLVLDST